MRSKLVQSLWNQYNHPVTVTALLACCSLCTVNLSVCCQKLIVPQRPMTFSLMENWFSCIPPIYKGETFPISHMNVTETCTIDAKCSSSTPGCKDYYWTFAVHGFRRSDDRCFTKYVGTSLKGKLTWNHFWDPDNWDHFLQEVSYGLVILKVIKLIQKKKKSSCSLATNALKNTCLGLTSLGSAAHLKTLKSILKGREKRAKKKKVKKSCRNVFVLLSDMG